MGQNSSSAWPQTSIPFRGNAVINAFPAGPKEAYLTLGGQLDSANAVNDSTDILTFGTVVSSLASSGHLWAIGKNGATYFYRGITMFDPSIAENEPMKSNGYLKGSPAVVMHQGPIRLTSWTSTHTSALTIPVLACKVVCKDSTGAIEFIGSATAVDSGWTDISAYVKVVSYEVNVGVLLNVKFY